MIDTANPECLAIVAAIRAGREVDPAWLDFLEDRDHSGKGWVATTADLLEAFLVPPKQVHRCRLCGGDNLEFMMTMDSRERVECCDCKASSPLPRELPEPAEDTSLQPLLVAWLRRCGDERAEADIFGARIDRANFTPRWVMTWGEGDEMRSEYFPTEAAARLALKRRVARMFPELRYQRQARRNLGTYSDQQWTTITFPVELTAEQLLEADNGR